MGVRHTPIHKYLHFSKLKFINTAYEKIVMFIFVTVLSNLFEAIILNYNIPSLDEIFSTPIFNRTLDMRYMDQLQQLTTKKMFEGLSMCRV